MSLMIGLIESGYHPHVVTPQENRFTEALGIKRIPYRVIPMDWWVSKKPVSPVQKLSLILKLPKSVSHLKKVIKEWEIDLVYTNTSVIPAGRLAAWRCKVPHIWHIREFGDIDFSLRLTFPASISRRIISSSRAVICNSLAVQDHWFKTLSSRNHLVYNGSVTKAEYSRLIALRKKRSSNQQFTFAMVSLITPKKGQEQAIRAIAVLKEQGMMAHLIIAGHGQPSYVQSCKELADSLKVSDLITFTGFIDDPYPVYLSADCVLICSENEALSRVALEAMACGTPVIARNSGGNPEIFSHMQTGLLYNDVSELVDSMAKAVQNPDWIRQIGFAGWQSARERFCIETYAGQVDKIIKSIIEE